MFLLTIPLITGILVIFQQGILGQNVAYTAVFSIACFCLYDIMFSLRDGFVRLREVMRSGKGSLSGVYKIVLHAVMLVSLLFIAWQQIILLRSPIFNSEVLAKTLANEPWELASTLISAVWVTWLFYRTFVCTNNKALGDIPHSRNVFSVLSTHSSDSASSVPWRSEDSFIDYLKEAWRKWQHESQKTQLPDTRGQFHGQRYFSLYSDELVKIFRGEYTVFTLFWIYGAGVGSVFWGTTVILFRGLLTLPADVEQNQILFATVPFLVGCYVSYMVILLVGLLRAGWRNERKNSGIFGALLATFVVYASVRVGFGTELGNYIKQLCIGGLLFFSVLSLRLYDDSRFNQAVSIENTYSSQTSLIEPVVKFVKNLILGNIPLWKTYWLCRSVTYVMAVWLTFPVITLLQEMHKSARTLTSYYCIYALLSAVFALKFALFFVADWAVVQSCARQSTQSLCSWLAMLMVSRDSAINIWELYESYFVLRSQWKLCLIFMSHHFICTVLLISVFVKYLQNEWDKNITKKFCTYLTVFIVCVLILCGINAFLQKTTFAWNFYVNFSYVDGMLSCCVGAVFIVTSGFAVPCRLPEKCAFGKRLGGRMLRFWNGEYSAKALFWKLGAFFLPVWSFSINVILLNAGVLLPPYGSQVTLARVWFVLVVFVSAFVHAVVCHGTLIAARREKLSKLEVFLVCSYLLVMAEVGLYLPFFDANHLNVLRKQAPLMIPFSVQVVLLLAVPLACACAFIRRVPRSGEASATEKCDTSKNTCFAALCDLFMRWFNGHLTTGVSFWIFTAGVEITMYMLAETFFKGVMESNAQGTVCTYVTLFCTFFTLTIGIGYPIAATLALIRSVRLHKPRKELGLIAYALSLGAMFFWALKTWTYLSQTIEQLNPVQLLSFHGAAAMVVALSLLNLNSSRLWAALCGGLIVVVLAYDLFFIPNLIEETWFPDNPTAKLVVSYWTSLFFIVDWLFSVIWFRQIVRLSSLNTADRDLGFIVRLLCGVFCIVRSSYFSRGGRMVLLVSVFLIFFYFDEKWNRVRIKKYYQ